jgi:hypothetical protein
MTMTSTNPSPTPLEDSEQKKSALLKFAERLRSAAADAGDSQATTVLDDFMTRFSSTKFLLFVAGDFKSGKSTLVNALVGRSICPVKATPRTAKVTRITAIDSESAPEEVVVSFKRDRAQDRRKLSETSVDDLVAVRGKETDLVDRVDIYIRPEKTLLRHPVRLVDTPGLGSSHAEHSLETRSYLERADVILFVFTASKPFSDAERLFLLENRSRLERFVFAVNQIDRVGDEAKEVVDYVAESLRTEVFPEGAGRPDVFAVSGLLELNGSSADSGIPTLVRAVERHLAQTHVARLVADIALQQIQIASSLGSELALAEEVLQGARASADALKPKLKDLRGELKRLAGDAGAIKKQVLSLPEGSAANRSARVTQVRNKVLSRIETWLQQCKSEDFCRRDLPAIVAKALTDEVEAIDQDVHASIEKLAQKELEELGAVFRKMESVARKILIPKGVVDVGSAGAFAKGAAALQALGAFALQVGGPTGGYGATAAALKTALAPSPEVRFLSVTAAASILVAMFGGPVGWVFAGVTSLLATILGFNHASTWRQRVLTNVASKFDEEVIPHLDAALKETIAVAARDLASEVEARTASVLERFEALIENVRDDLDAQEAKHRSDLSRIANRRKDLAELQRELTGFAEASAPTNPASQKPSASTT